MIRISNIKIRPWEIEASEKEAVAAKIREKWKNKKNPVGECQLVKRSIDARKKPDVFYLYTVDVSFGEEAEVWKKKALLEKGGWSLQPAAEEKYVFPDFGAEKLEHPPVIVGAGPAGYFCGLFLARAGYRPVILERGKCVAERSQDVEAFWEGKSPLNPESNVQFGEGGAGTFSDGKLNTMVKDVGYRNKEVLRNFVKAGAPEDILYINKPHVGTDVLKEVVVRLREEIESLGGQVRFESKFTDVTISDGKVTEITINDNENISCDCLVLALGHSARDTFSLLEEKGFAMKAKSFAVGVRVQHPQEMIQFSQYGAAGETLPAADYKLTCQTEGGRGVYSFCMCPGGYVVNASSEEGMTAVNGMSYRDRSGANANSALIVTVTPEDFPGEGPLAGVEFQRQLEKIAYQKGMGKIPVQLYGDYKENVISTEFGETKPAFCGEYHFANIREIFPESINEALVSAMPQFGRKIKGFDREDAIFAGVESRTSSPVRIERNEDFISNIAGVYPCGEGAGYAGGITSACMDGIRVAEAIAKKYAPFGKEGR